MIHLTGGGLDGGIELFLSGNHFCMDPSAIFPCYFVGAIGVRDLALLRQAKTPHIRSFFWRLWLGQLS